VRESEPDGWRLDRRWSGGGEASKMEKKLSLLKHYVD
jgi:hypothetical protein